MEKEKITQDAVTSFATMLRKKVPHLQSIWLDPINPTHEQLLSSDKIARLAETIIIATRNAHLNPKQHEAAEKLLNQSNILVCLRNPYDAGILYADTTFLTLGDSTPSLQAAADALLGDYKPTGKLNVPLTMK